MLSVVLANVKRLTFKITYVRSSKIRVHLAVLEILWRSARFTLLLFFVSNFTFSFFSRKTGNWVNVCACMRMRVRLCVCVYMAKRTLSVFAYNRRTLCDQELTMEIKHSRSINLKIIIINTIASRCEDFVCQPEGCTRWTLVSWLTW